MTISEIFDSVPLMTTLGAVGGALITTVLSPVVKWRLIEKKKLELEKQNQEEAQEHEVRMELIERRRQLIASWRLMVSTLANNAAAEPSVRTGLRAHVDFLSLSPPPDPR